MQETHFDTVLEPAFIFFGRSGSQISGRESEIKSIFDLVSNHHFKWWFANSPIRAEYMRRLKAVLQAVLLLPLKAAYRISCLRSWILRSVCGCTLSRFLRSRFQRSKHSTPVPRNFYPICFPVPGAYQKSSVPTFL